MKEIWKDVVGYEGLYQVSNLGRVKSLTHLVKCHKTHYRTQHGKILTSCLDGKYYHVTLYIKGKRKIHLVHRLVAQSFLPNPNHKATVNHKNGNKLDNNVNNLEWATLKENTQHALRTGLKIPQTTHYRGVLAFNFYDNSFVGEYSSQHEAAKELNLSVGRVCGVLHGRGKHTHGYTFRYSNKEKVQNRIY